MTDIDGFKMVNAEFGHPAGDQVLQHTAQVLKQSCRKGDCVARMGGDEFVLLLAEAEPRAVSERMQELDRLVAEESSRVCGVSFLRLSAGAAFYPDDGVHAEELLAIADARMYETKRLHHRVASRTTGLGRLAEMLDAPLEPKERLTLSHPRE